ncbi:5654_t:CDS:1 [Funneliformis geosporum]|uniref:5100_t:CDS:1 n=1 Tax=Funneliformis geosporum TaxID=1117311 RepID=A0A9W4STD7_9GLOM|nr:5654_t:CDS:1 [Funneliformis geosporum]CAI2179839.1 5100_t:CDS:1 [Funneliformis geosporum]
MSDDVLPLQKRHPMNDLRFQHTSVHQLESNSLQVMIDHNKETLMKGQTRSDMNNRTLDSNHEILEKSNFIANESLHLSNNKEISGEPNLSEENNLGKNTLDHNQQVLEKSISFANDETSTTKSSLNHDKDTKSYNEFAVKVDNQTSKTDDDSSYRPFIQTEGRDIDDIWSEYNNLTREQFKTMTIKDFNNILGSLKKFLINSDAHEKLLVHGKMLSIFSDLEMKAKLKPDVSTYNILMSTAFDLKDFSKLQNLFQIMKRQEIKPNTVSYNIMISGTVKLGHRPDAFKLYNEMVDLRIERSNITYVMLLSACARDYRFVDALSYHEKMLKEGIKPDVYNYNTLLRVLMNNADRSKLIGIYDVMKKQGVKPTIVTYNYLIKAMILRGEKEYAKKFFDEMKNEGINPSILILDSFGITGIEAIQKSGDQSGKHLDVIDYNTLLRGCVKKSEYHDAFEIFNLMRENKVAPNLATYTIIIGAYLQKNEIEFAMELFNKMKYDNVAPDSQIYTFMIDSLLNQGKTKQAFNLLSEITNLNYKTSNKIGFNKKEVIRLLDSASKLEDNDVIENLFREISRTPSQLTSGVFEKVLWCVAQGKDEERIEYYLEYMRKREIPIQNTTYEAIIDGFIQKKDKNNSIYWYEQMADKEYVPTGKIIFRMMQFFSNSNEIIRYWDDFYRYGIRPGKDDVNLIIDYCCSGKSNKDLVSRVFFQCRKMKFVPTNEILLKIMQFYSKRGQTMRVVEYLDNFYIFGIKPELDVISFILDFCCKLKDKRLISKILSQCSIMGFDGFSLYRSKRSNVETDSIDASLLQASDPGDAISSHENSLELIENWIYSKGKNKRKFNFEKIKRIRRILDLEEKVLLRHNKLDPVTRKSIQTWIPYSAAGSKGDTGASVEKKAESDSFIDHESDIDSIIEKTFREQSDEKKISS